MEDLIQLVKQIRCDFDSLSADLRDFDSLSAEDLHRCAARFEQLQSQFDAFSRLAKNAPEGSEELAGLKSQLSSCYTKFHLLRSGWVAACARAEAEPQRERDPNQDPEPEKEPEHEPLPEPEEEELSAEEAAPKRKKKRCVRLRRPAAAIQSFTSAEYQRENQSFSAEEYRRETQTFAAEEYRRETQSFAAEEYQREAQTFAAEEYRQEEAARQAIQQEAARYRGIDVRPDQPVTEADIRHHEYREAERQRLEEEKTTAHRQQREKVFQEHQERMQRSEQFEHIGNSHIDMSHSAELQPSDSKPAENTTQSAASGRSTDTSNQTACYQLSAITHVAGGVATTVFNSALARTGNDAIRAATATAYYTNLAAHAVSGVTVRPYASLQHGARQIIPNGAGHSSAMMQEYFHRRKLDKEIYDKLTANGHVPRTQKGLQRASDSILRGMRKNAEAQFGDNLQLSCGAVRHRLNTSMSQAKDLKMQIRQLKAAGRLGENELAQLNRLMREKAGLTREIANLKQLQQAKGDLAYASKRLQAVQNARMRKAQGLQSTAALARSLMLRSLRERGSDTEGMGYALEIASNRYVRQVTHLVARAPVKLAGATVKMGVDVVRVTAPNFYAKAVSLEQAAIGQVQHAITVSKQFIQTSVRTAGKAIWNAVPSPLRNGVENTIAATKKLYSDVATGVKNLQYWLANTDVGKAYAGLKAFVEKIAEGLEYIVSILQKAKVVLIIAGLFIVVALIAGLAAPFAAVSSQFIILSPADPLPGNNSKINLSPYAQIVMRKTYQWTKRIEVLTDDYERNERIEEVTITYTSGLDNTKDLLTMMAVRTRQGLEDNRELIEQYLSDMFTASHHYSINQSVRYCSGCEPEYVPRIVGYDPITLAPIYEFELKYRCPGHISIKVVVSVSFLPNLYDVDTFEYDDDAEDWEGWTDEEIAWADQIYAMDWNELYDGVVVLGGTGERLSIRAPESEARIWQFFKDRIGSSYGAACIIGNLYRASGLDPRFIPDTSAANIGYSNSNYADAVDSGLYEDFVSDGVPFGLGGWKRPEDKEKLLAYARARGVSVGNLDMQMVFIMESIPATVMPRIQNATSLAAGAAALQSTLDGDYTSDILTFGGYFWNKYVLGILAEGALTSSQLAVIRVATHSADYGIPNNAGYCQQWAAYVYSVAGFALDGSCCAYHSGLRYGVSGDMDHIPPGATIYGFAGNKYGHVGIYVGNGLVYHNIGHVAVDPLDRFIKAYDCFAWGWEGGTDLTIS